jgi:peptide/nickel transport system permease protein
MALMHNESYWERIWRQYKQRPTGRLALFVVLCFCFVGIYAPFLAAGKPLIVEYDGVWYFPLFRYLFYPGYYTKRIDLFFNLLMFKLPLFLLLLACVRNSKLALGAWLAVQSALFLLLVSYPLRDPAFDAALSKAKEQALPSHALPDWSFDLRYMSPYARLNLLIHSQIIQTEHERLLHAHPQLKELPTLWQMQKNNEEREVGVQKKMLQEAPEGSAPHAFAQAFIQYTLQRRAWIEAQLPLLQHEWMPLLRPFHWEEDAGGSRQLNQYLHFWELTRINGKDLMSALIFGVRISLVVGLMAVGLALAIGLPIGTFAGYYGGTFDIIVCRLMEIWEAMPTFFMLLMTVAILQSKSIFLVILVIGIFSWTNFSRYMRGEFFKQRNLSYVEACRAAGFNNRHIMFSEILPNALPPVLTLLPFAVMAAISTEAGLSFLGLGEEGSCSWGVLMEEGRAAFPGQSYLLWPPAILLTILLVAIALAGDTLRDAMDPKMA